MRLGGVRWCAGRLPFAAAAGVEPRFRDERIEDRERGSFVGRPAEHVAAQGEWRDPERGLAELSLLHGGRERSTRLVSLRHQEHSLFRS